MVDTNIVVYSLDGRFPAKRAIARALLTEPSKVLSCQTLTESASVLMTKLGMSASDVAGVVRGLSRYEIVPLTPIIVERALGIVSVTPRKIWDALMIAAAVEAGCRVVYSEDMGDGEVIEGVRIVNPFR